MLTGVLEFWVVCCCSHRNLIHTGKVYFLFLSQSMRGGFPPSRDQDFSYRKAPWPLGLQPAMHQPRERVRAGVLQEVKASHFHSLFTLQFKASHHLAFAHRLASFLVILLAHNLTALLVFSVLRYAERTQHLKGIECVIPQLLAGRLLPQRTTPLR